MIKKIFSIPGLIVLILILGVVYVGLWMALRSTVVSGITDYISESEQEGYRIEHGGLSVDGFPFSIDARSPNITIRTTPNSAASVAGNWAIETGEISMASSTLTPLSWSIVHQGQLGVEMKANNGVRTKFDVSPANIDADIVYSLSGSLKSLRTNMSSAQINPLMGGKPAVLSLAGLNAEVVIDGDIGKVDFVAKDIVMSQQVLGVAYTALGQNISRASLTGEVQNFPLIEMEGLETWLQSPAKIKSDDWQLLWGTADIVGSFDIGFKNNLPEGVIRFRVKNIEALMQSLMTLDLMDPSFAVQFTAAVNSLQPDEDGRQSIEITIRDGVVKYGFFTLFRL